MIVRKLPDIRGTSRCVRTDTWESARILLDGDGMGFSFHVTTIFKGSSIPIHYKHHVEAVYIVSGTGALEDRETGEKHRLEPGVFYALDRHDPHVLTAETEITMICV